MKTVFFKIQVVLPDVWCYTYLGLPYLLYGFSDIKTVIFSTELTRPTEAPGLHTAHLHPSISPLFLEEQYTCEIDEFKVSITKDNKDVRTFEMRTVKDVANLYLVCSKLKRLVNLG